MKYHVYVRGTVGLNHKPECSLSTFDEAREYALRAYRNSTLDTLVEITHAGLIVWGPFVVGGKYKPTYYP